MIQQQAVKRDPYFDSLKFILITLVVFGHAISFVEGKWANALYLWIYLFHMPLFIFVSGYFTKQLPTEKFKKGILGLAETLIVFQIISRLLRYFLEGEACSLTLLVTPFWILWYLMALILWRTILQITPPQLVKIQ